MPYVSAIAVCEVRFIFESREILGLLRGK